MSGPLSFTFSQRHIGHIGVVIWRAMGVGLDRVEIVHLRAELCIAFAPTAQALDAAAAVQKDQKTIPDHVAQHPALRNIAPFAQMIGDDENVIHLPDELHVFDDALGQGRSPKGAVLRVSCWHHRDQHHSGCSQEPSKAIARLRDRKRQLQVQGKIVRTHKAEGGSPDTQHALTLRRIFAITSARSGTIT